MTYEAYASLIIRDDFMDPDTITEATGVEPSHIWRKDQLLPRSTVARSKTNGWRLISRLERDRELDDHIADVLAQIQPAWIVFVGFGQRYSLSMICDVRSYDREHPPISFSRETVRRCAALNADLDVDLYIF